MTELEERIARAYDDLHPSPGVEEELLEALPAARAEPRRILPYVLWPAAAAAVVALVLVLPREAAPTLADGSPDVDVPVVEKAPAVKSDGALEIRVAKGGRVLVRLEELDGEWAQVSLNGFAKYLAKANRDRPLLLRADRDVPWRHLQWVMTVCAEEHRAKLLFAAKDPEGKEIAIDASVPTDEGIEKKPKLSFKLSISKNGDQVSGVGTPPKEARVIELAAEGNVPFRYVVEFLAGFRALGVQDVRFTGTQVPDEELRKKLTLPAPKAREGSAPEGGDR